MTKRTHPAAALLLSAWLATGCSGPAPEIPGTAGLGPAAGMGGVSGASGEGGFGETGGVGGIAAGAGGVGGLGGVGGMGGTGGTAGFGMGGVGGTTPEPCTDSDATGPHSGTPAPEQLLVRGVAKGRNGTFEDSCDEDGNLVEHVCDTHFTCSSGGGAEGACAPSEQLTGDVSAVTIPCAGQCMDGACHVPCPSEHDVITAARIEGDHYTFEAGRLGLHYECRREPCALPPPAQGDELSVVIAVPNAEQRDCRGPWGDAVEPLSLSDGCTYVDCVAVKSCAYDAPLTCEAVEGQGP